jgi:hypothetical protein
VDRRVVGHRFAAPPEHGWIPSTTVNSLRDVVSRYLDGERNNVGKDVEALAAALATAAHGAGHTPERLIIAVRELWRDLGLVQLDRLQLAALYDRLVRRTIDCYYQD